MKKVLLSFTFILCNVLIGFSQSANSNDDVMGKNNNVKISLTSLAFKNVQFQYERILTKRIGVVIGYSFISKGSVPFKSQINDLVADDPDTKDIFNNAELGYSAITPEVRFYLGKGYGKGFYIAPFYRHIKYDISGVNFKFESDLLAGQQENINMGGKLTANTFGLQFGAQFNLGKNIILDWWIAGPHYGTSKGDFDGKTNRTLTPNEQAELQKELDSIDLPIGDVTAKATANGATLNISGPWAGIRSGLSLGYRF